MASFVLARIEHKTQSLPPSHTDMHTDTNTRKFLGVSLPVRVLGGFVASFGLDTILLLCSLGFSRLAAVGRCSNKTKTNQAVTIIVAFYYNFVFYAMFWPECRRVFFLLTFAHWAQAYSFYFGYWGGAPATHNALQLHADSREQVRDVQSSTSLHA